MLKLVFAALVLMIAASTSAQDHKPTVFGDPGSVVVGPQRIETDFTWAQGKWSNADAKVGINSTIIHCYRKFGFCEEAEGYSFGGQSWVNLTSLDILRWDAQE